ncbi:MAG: hypothetical protein IGS49_14840 [Chlorogloeopsis fritschii C42_A2020_084]|uniref:hypothetical protein n=1 Tax=Chlorogloeopsis fritschii TaxID=1124 RepID=UPI001A0B1C61|nr:hypothetical protein [Chlorogloeopsis fritschii]MBF2006702.1 hypothetical protein [Chlorogloeopsis fritschii C42_A2020_084]
MKQSKYYKVDIPFEKVCVVCDRPRQISLDSENRLHKEAEPAMQVADWNETKLLWGGTNSPPVLCKLNVEQLITLAQA